MLKPRIACAIYTRKSSEEGLEQSFNSLDAQREACEAFIRSQKHEGWTLVPARFDDGGYSGGTMQRPGLQQLLAEVKAKRIGAVVVYKVDRLTRSLADFAKIVEIFDAHGVSFVSVTQSFNTTTSMGRLTLNVLLSFAQFEREVTGERIRDKIAASKQKGMWMGGNPPLGYDVAERKLIVNAAEAETVSQIFRRYLALKSARALKAALDAEDVSTKKRLAANGVEKGGRPFSRGALYALLQNPIYRGQIAHRGAIYPGSTRRLSMKTCGRRLKRRWLRTASSERIARAPPRRACSPGLSLTPMATASPPPTSIRAAGVIAIMSAAAWRPARGPMRPGPAASPPPIWSAPCLAASSPSCAIPPQAFDGAGDADHAPSGAPARAAQLAARLDARPTPHEVAAIVSRIDVLAVTLRLAAIIERDGARGNAATASAGRSGDEATIRLTTPVQLTRAGLGMRLLTPSDARAAAPGPSLIKLLVKPHALRRAAWAAPEETLAAAAKRKGLSPSYAARLLHLAFLAPDIKAAILDGRQPPNLTARQLMLDTRLPLDWAAQRQKLGFPAVT
ncbi:MAG: recombinase family protein [Hyphomicrobiales bacterium]|nr:recombinase family protein [Hyphomicrobiales bacterium]